MEFEILAKAVSSIPHIGQLLSVTLTIAISIYEELKKLDASLAAERELGEEASYIIRDVALYSRNLRASDPIHLERLAKQLKNVEQVATRIRKHIWDASWARQKHLHKYGRALTDLYECTIESGIVWILREQLKEAKVDLMEEFQWIKIMEGDRGGTEEPFNIVTLKPIYQDDHPDSKVPQRVRWIKREDLEVMPHLCKLMVPVCRHEDSDGGILWYVARIPHIGGRRGFILDLPLLPKTELSHAEPGKFKPGDGAYFGYKHEAFLVGNLEFDVLIAVPGSVRWEHMTGRFSEERLRPARPVRGCYENDGTELVIARAWAKEHMHIGIFTDKHLQAGKAGPRSNYALVTVGKKEKKIEQYEVLVYA